MLTRWTVARLCPTSVSEGEKAVTYERLNDSSQTKLFLTQAAQGSPGAIPKLLARYRGYMARLVELKLDDELRRRFDPSDIIQESQLAILRRMEDYLGRRSVSFKIWLRGEVLRELIRLRRAHVVAQKRSVYREVTLTDVSSLMIARSLLSSGPCARTLRNEKIQRVRDAIDALGDIDREILSLRYVEELDNGEVAELLGIAPEAARKRHGRAVRRLTKKLVDIWDSSPGLD